MEDAFFVAHGNGRFEATALTRGPWDRDAQHAGPPAALLGRAIEHRGARADASVARLTVEILAPVPLGALEVETAVLRPGRSVQLLGAVLHARGREVMRCTAWQIRTQPDGGVPRVTRGFQPPPGPQVAQTQPFFPVPWDVGYHTAMEWRFVAGGFTTPGPATVWMRMRHPLVADESPSPLTRVLIAADSGNGVSSALDFRQYVFINTDLTVYLSRPAVGEWVCLQAATSIEPSGVGLAESVLFDERGAIGRGLQSLFVAQR